MSRNVDKRTDTPRRWLGISVADIKLQHVSINWSYGWGGGGGVIRWFDGMDTLRNSTSNRQLIFLTVAISPTGDVKTKAVYNEHIKVYLYRAYGFSDGCFGNFMLQKGSYARVSEDLSRYGQPDPNYFLK